MQLPPKLYKAWTSDNIILHLVLIALAGLVVWGLTCGLWSLGGADETRYPTIAKNLIDNGQVFLLTLDGQPYDQKPPLVFWLFAIALKLCGGELNAFAPRMVSTIFALITLGCVYICGRKLVNAKTGLYGAFILATFPTFMSYAPKAKLDMIFAAFITLAIAAVVTRKAGQPVSWLRAFAIWGGLAGAFFAKGPLALVIVLLFIVPYAISFKKDWRRVLLQLRFFWGLAFVFALICLWLGIEIYLVGPSFVTGQVGGETVERMLQGAHKKPVWFYFTNIFSITGVWALGLMAALVMLVRRKAPRIPNLRVWVLWFVPGFVLLCLASGKRTPYILPLLPPLALFIGFYINRWVQEPAGGKIIKYLTFGFYKICIIAGAGLCLVCVVLFFRMALVWRYGFYLTPGPLACAFGVGLALIIVGLLARKKPADWGVFCGALIAVMLAFNFFHNAVIAPAIDVNETPRYFNQNLTLMYPELLNEPLGAVKKSDDGTSVRNVAGFRYNAYGKYKTAPVTYNQNMFAADNAAALPGKILMHANDFARLQTPPETGGFTVAFWDRIEGKHNVVLLRRMAEMPYDAETPVTEAGGLAPEETARRLAGYMAQCGGQSPAWLDVCIIIRSESANQLAPENEVLGNTGINPGLAVVYTVNMQKGFGNNVYALNWLLTQEYSPEAEHKILNLAHMPQNFKPGLPYGRAFNKWALKAVIKKNKIERVFFGDASLGAAAGESLPWP